MNRTEHPTATATGIRSSDRLRIARFVWRVDHHLDGHVPRGRRREIREELRANLRAAGADLGIPVAVQRLGHPRDLAARYIEAAGGPVRWRTGGLAAAGGFLVMHVIVLVFSVAFSAGAETVGGPEATWSYAYEVADGFGPFVGAHEPAGTFSVSILTPTHLAVMVIAFVLGARLWRWRPGRG